MSFQTISINYHNDIFITNSWKFPRGHGLSFNSLYFCMAIQKSFGEKTYEFYEQTVVGKLNLKIFAAIQFNFFILIVWSVLGR